MAYFQSLTDGRKKRDAKAGIQDFATLCTPIARQLYTHSPALNDTEDTARAWISRELLTMFNLIGCPDPDNPKRKIDYIDPEIFLYYLALT